MNVQLVPEPFVEIPAEMAQEMGLAAAKSKSLQQSAGSYIAKAMVTKRIKAMTIDGKKVYQIGIPFIKDIGASPRMRARTRGRW